MSTLGETLKQARERKQVTASVAAADTRIKVQHIEAMEQGDFSSIAAPAYVKGFIKLYAEYLGLDPEPLIEEYQAHHAPKERAPLVVDEPSLQEPTEQERVSRWKRIEVPWSAGQLRRGARWAVTALVAVLVVFGADERADEGPLGGPVGPCQISDVCRFEPTYLR